MHKCFMRFCLWVLPICTPESIMEYLNHRLCSRCLNPCLRSHAVTIQDVKIDHIDGNAIVKFQNMQYNRGTLC